ncbi:MAG TPA: MFS transporter [Bacteroidales bacterium]|nr:MFS transporter [Bacteroidales bacterium]HPT00971.1 MFS transporter [Bacteroidales bacterium]
MLRKILTRTILLVSFVSLFTDIASEMLYPIMPVYLRSIGFSVLLIGILEGMAEATAGLSKGYFGNLSDKMAKRAPFVRWGYMLSAISKPMMAAFVYPLWIFFARTLDRLGKGVRTGARDAILSDETTPEHKGKVFGFHRALDTVGAAIGPLLALVYLYYYPQQYKWLFIIAFIPGLIAVLLTLLLKDKQVSSKQRSQVGFLAYLGYWKKAGKQYKLLVIGLLFFTLFNSSDAFLLLAVKNQGLSDTAMIGVYVFYNLIYALLSFPVGIMADRIGLRTTLVTGLFVFAGVYGLMGFAVSVPQFIMLFGFYALYAAATEGVSKALITNMAAREETATAIGFYTSFASIFTMLASSLAGFLWFALGPRPMFLISGIGVAIAAIFLGTNRFLREKTTVGN